MSLTLENEKALYWAFFFINPACNRFSFNKNYVFVALNQISSCGTAVFIFSHPSLEPPAVAQTLAGDYSASPHDPFGGVYLTSKPKGHSCGTAVFIFSHPSLESPSVPQTLAGDYSASPHDPCGGVYLTSKLPMAIPAERLFLFSPIRRLNHLRWLRLWLGIIRLRLMIPLAGYILHPNPKAIPAERLFLFSPIRRLSHLRWLRLWLG